MPESCDIVLTQSINFDIVPVYGQFGVEVSGVFAVLYFCG